MEYYMFVLNRSFEITISPTHLSGAWVRGMLAADAPAVYLARATGDATDLVDRTRLTRSREQAPGSPEYMALHPANFSIPRKHINGMRFVSRNKWGMGPVPHSGRIYVRAGKKERELILLGQQDGEGIIRSARSLGYLTSVEAAA
jgi:hypothetical protein